MRQVIITTLCLLTASAIAQPTPAFVHEVSYAHTNELRATDFWIVVPMNYEFKYGKYIEVYITSREATGVTIEGPFDSTFSARLKPFEVFTYRLPLAWEMTTSGETEDKGIRIRSDFAGLSV